MMALMLSIHEGCSPVLFSQRYPLQVFTTLPPQNGQRPEVYQLRAKLERSAKGYVDLAQLQYINGVINYMDVLEIGRAHV